LLVKIAFYVPTVNYTFTLCALIKAMQRIDENAGTDVTEIEAQDVRSHKNACANAFTA
jgi:hypothetical protein